MRGEHARQTPMHNMLPYMQVSASCCSNLRDGLCFSGSTGSSSTKINNSDSKRKRTQLSNSDKRRICELARKSGHLSQIELAEKVKEDVGLAAERTTISKILKESDRCLSISEAEGNKKRARGGKHEALEAALWTWFQQVKIKLRLFSTVAEITSPWLLSMPPAAWKISWQWSA